MQDSDWTNTEEQESYRKYSMDTTTTDTSSRKSSVDYTKQDWTPTYQFALVQPTDTKYTFLKPVK
jgi:hypothetical protein